MRWDIIRNDIPVLGMKGLIYHSLFCVIYNLASEKTLFMNLKILLLYVPLLLFALIRRKCGNFFLFLLMHAAISGAFVLVFSDLEERIVFGGGTIILAVASMYMRFRGAQEEECPSSASLVFFLICYMAARQMNRQQLMQICCYEVFIFLILFMTYKNLSGTTLFLKSAEKIANLPVKQIKGMNRILLGIFLFFMAAGMMLVPAAALNRIFDGLRQLFLFILRQIILAILALFQNEEAQSQFFEAHKQAQAQMGLMETAEPSLLAQILERLFIAVFAVILIAGTVYLLMRAIYKWYQRFYEQNRDTADESEFLWESPLHIPNVKNRKKKQKQSDKSINIKIRKRYKKYIRKRFGTGEHIPVVMTTTELEQLLSEKNPGEIYRAAEASERDEKSLQRIRLYQKARYSPYECVKQDLEAMKQSSPKL